MYAPIVTSALFMGTIFYDLIVNASQKEILKHFLFGLVATSAMAFLTLRGAELAAWGLLLIPVLAVFISSIVAAYKTPSPPPAPAPFVIVPEVKPKEKETESVINTPIDTPYMKTICMEVEQPPCPSSDTPVAKCGFNAKGEIVPPEGACPKPEPPPEPSPSCPSVEQPKQAADLITAVKSKLTPAIACPSAGTA